MPNGLLDGRRLGDVSVLLMMPERVPLVLGQEPRAHPAEDVVHDRLGDGISVAVNPAGSKRMWANLLTRSRSGTPYWSDMEVMVASESIRPLIGGAFLGHLEEISPG